MPAPPPPVTPDNGTASRPDREPKSPSPLPRPARRAGAVIIVMLAALLLAALIAAVWIGVRGATAYGHLRDAQATARGIAEDFGDPAQASAAIASISGDTAAARELTGDPVWGLAERMPWLGPQLAAFATVAVSLDDVASQSLAPLVEVASTFSVDALRPQAGRIDLSGFVAARQPAQQAADGVAQATASVTAIDRTPLIAPVRQAVDDVTTLLRESEGVTASLARATQLIPAMLGADGPRNYLVLFQNNAEWRSLGGIPGAMALIHTDGGSMTLTAQASAGDFPRYDESVLPLSPEIESVFGQRPGRWMQNVTQLPDFADSGALAREMWSRQFGGDPVDGVLAVDPVTLSYLLRATGPVQLPTGDQLTADNAVSLLLNEVYLRYRDPTDQDTFFAAAAAAVFDALASGRADPQALLDAVVQAGDERRLLIWSALPDDQQVLAGTTLAGALPTDDGRTAGFGVYLNDGTGSKMDFYQTADTAIAWQDCTQDASGRPTGTVALTVTITSHAPADAAQLNPYITGGGIFGVPPGTARTVVYLYLPQRFELIDATVSTGSGFGGGMVDGRRVLTFSVDLAPGESANAQLTAINGDSTAAQVTALQTPTLSPTDAASATCAAG